MMHFENAWHFKPPHYKGGYKGGCRAVVCKHLYGFNTHVAKLVPLVFLGLGIQGGALYSRPRKSERESASNVP
jgi:hypothetical protein